jgi:Na+-transporting NADH:ubiquinone oxidoreductase subunit NqrD
MTANVSPSFANSVSIVVVVVVVAVVVVVIAQTLPLYTHNTRKW